MAGSEGAGSTREYGFTTLWYLHLQLVSCSSLLKVTLEFLTSFVLNNTEDTVAHVCIVYSPLQTGVLKQT